MFPQTVLVSRVKLRYDRHSGAKPNRVASCSEVTSVVEGRRGGVDVGRAFNAELGVALS